MLNKLVLENSSFNFLTVDHFGDLRISQKISINESFASDII